MDVLISQLGFNKGEIIEIIEIINIESVICQISTSQKPYRTELSILIGMVYDGVAQFRDHSINVSLYKNRENVSKYFNIVYHKETNHFDALINDVDLRRKNSQIILKRERYSSIDPNARVAHCWRCKSDLYNNMRRCKDCVGVICKCGACICGMKYSCHRCGARFNDDARKCADCRGSICKCGTCLCSNSY